MTDSTNTVVWEALYDPFGKGIVNTPADFGLLGERPAHPELLDWLATELPRQGGSLKQLHRLILQSAVYQQASQPASSRGLTPTFLPS